MDPITLALIGGSTALSVLGGTDEKERKEPFPGYNNNIEDLLNQAKSKMNTPGATSSIDFGVRPSDISNKTTESVLGKISNPTDYSAYSKDLSSDLYKARKAQIDEQYADEQKRQANMYNRLGLVSSSPFLQASQDLGRKQTTDINAVGAQHEYDDYVRQYEAKKFGDTLGLNYLNLGNQIGEQDAANQRFAKGSAYTDFARAANEPLQWANIASSILGGQQPYYPQETPSTASQIGMAGQDIGSMMLLYSMLGKKD